MPFSPRLAKGHLAVTTNTDLGAANMPSSSSAIESTTFLSNDFRRSSECLPRPILRRCVAGTGTTCKALCTRTTLYSTKTVKYPRSNPTSTSGVEGVRHRVPLPHVRFPSITPGSASSSSRFQSTSLAARTNPSATLVTLSLITRSPTSTCRHVLSILYCSRRSSGSRVNTVPPT
jgi:hypothetical protein